MMKRRILVVEDDVSLAKVLCDNLEYEGFQVSLSKDGESALAKAQAFRPDLVLLDLMLPRLSGFEVCEHLNREASATAIIIITARDQKDDKLQGFQLGADDYITKPFTLDELLARVHAVMRRVRPTTECLVLGQFRFDFTRYSATRGARRVTFTQREMEVLHFMSERSGKVVTREELLQKVWGYKNTPLTRCVDNLVARLRLKIEPDPHQPKYIQTVHGDGYRLSPSE
jgi:DNA-binding response OmpR family regulator